MEAVDGVFEHAQLLEPMRQRRRREPAAVQPVDAGRRRSSTWRPSTQAAAASRPIMPASAIRPAISRARDTSKLKSSATVPVPMTSATVSV